MSPTPQQFLLSTERGAYTTMFVRDGCLLVDWPTHLERLVRSLKALHDTISGFYTNYYDWLEMGERVRLATATADEHAALQHLLAPAIKAALASAAGAAESAVPNLMLIIVLPPASDLPCGLDVRVHVHACGPAGSSPPGTAVILGGPRSIPIGKDSGWVAERQVLERAKPAGNPELLLCTQDGRLLEGLVTNLFVVTLEEGEGSGSDGSSDDSSDGRSPSVRGDSGSRSCSGTAEGHHPAGDDVAGRVVWTASMRDGVVWGTIRARVVEVCRQLGITLREEAPSMHSRHTWCEAFLTNSLRLVQPLNSIACGAGNVWGHEPWALELPAAPGPVAAMLQAALLSLLPTYDAALL